MNILTLPVSGGCVFTVNCWDPRSGIRCVILFIYKNIAAVFPLGNPLQR